MNATKAEWTELDKAAQAAFLVRPARVEFTKEGLRADTVPKRLLMPKSALAKHNCHHNGYEVSIGKREQIEECFG